jgi:hypothetical protein
MRRRRPNVRTARGFRSFLTGNEGAAAAELMLWATALTVPVLSVLDLAVYAVKVMEVQTAAEQGVEAARKACGFSAVPITSASNCTQATMNSAVTTGVQGTSLGSSVAVASGYPAEQYYCVNSSGALVGVGTAGTSGAPPTPPTTNDCSSVIAGSAGAPGDYVKVRATYAFSPTFPGISLSSALPSTITATAWLRLQ